MQKSMGEFRGLDTFRDRLRAVECPMDLIDQIGGWKSVSSKGNSYGQGYDLSKIREKIEAIAIPHQRN